METRDQLRPPTRSPDPAVRLPWQGHSSQNSPERASHLFLQASRAQGPGKHLPRSPTGTSSSIRHRRGQRQDSGGQPQTLPLLTVFFPSPQQALGQALTLPSTSLWAPGS